MSDVTLRDRIKSEEIRKNWNAEEMKDDIQNYQLKWNQLVLRLPENRIPRKSTAMSTPRKKGFWKTLPSLERPVHVVAERELNPKLRIEEEEEEEEGLTFYRFIP